MENCVLLVVLDERYFNFIVWAPFLYQISIVEIFSLDQSGGPNKPTTAAIMDKNISELLYFILSILGILLHEVGAVLLLNVWEKGGFD